MRVTVKHSLSKTRNPSEHKIKLENQTGELIQVVGDGWCLVEFEYKIVKKIRVDSKTQFVNERLQWYIHELDFFIKQDLLVTKFQ